MVKTVRVKIDKKNVQKSLGRMHVTSLTHAGGLVRKISRRSIRKQGKTRATRHAKPGNPPKTKAGLIRRSILYSEVTRKGFSSHVYVGPVHFYFANVGKPHEYSGIFRGRKYPKRPFMFPALLKARPYLMRFYTGRFK